jgi:acetate---CoA ligase (ADP-forming)
MTAAIDALFAPRSVAIVGDSPGGGRGAMMRANLERLGFDGAIYPVNPKYDQIAGRPCFPSLSAVGSEFDVVLAAVSAPRAVETVREAGRLGAGAAVVIASGFAEAGSSGVDLQQQLTDAAAEYGMAVCGPNCYGVFNLAGGFAGYGGPTPVGLRRGGTALLMQSGALTHALLNPASLRGLGISHLVTTGNEAVLRLGDFVQHAVEDPDTSVIACFIEGLRDPGRFADALVAAAAAGKPVVVCKTGRSQAARVAAVAHTGALAGSDDAFDALCEATGTVRVDDLDQLVEACLLLSSKQPVRAPVVIASISGGGSGVMADLCAREGLALATYSEETAGRLREVLPTFANVGNPLDLTGAVGEQPDLVTSTTEILGAAGEIGSLAFALNASTADNDAELGMYSTMLRDAAAGAKASTSAFVGFTMTSGPMHPTLIETAAECGVPLLMGMQEAITVMGRVATAQRNRRDWQRSARAGSPGGERRVLSESESKVLLAEAGVMLPRETVVSTADEAVAEAEAVGYPVVVKVDSAAIPHKTEAGCIRIGLTTPAEVRTAVSEVSAAADVAGAGAPYRILVAEMVPDGLDLVVGALVEPEIGHLVVVGLGGTLVELQAGTRSALTPVGPGEAHDLLGSKPISRLLAGYRGGSALDTEAAAASIAAISRLLEAHPEILELDVNPLRVLPEGKGAVALDGLIVTGSA